MKEHDMDKREALIKRFLRGVDPDKIGERHLKVLIKEAQERHYKDRKYIGTLWRDVANTAKEKIQDELCLRGCEKVKKALSTSVKIGEYGPSRLTISASGTLARRKEFQNFMREIDGIENNPQMIKQQNSFKKNTGTEKEIRKYIEKGEYRYTAFEPIDMVQALNTVLSEENRIDESRFLPAPAQNGSRGR
jgi:hypothetical protein